MHLGAILPNYGEGSSPDGIRRAVSLAEELGFDSVWTTEHIVVGPDALADPYRRVYDSLVTLGWIAGWTERIALGTSIVIVPLHNPFQLAKQAATVQELSGGRLTLGVGMGWYEREYEFMGVPFEGRGRRGDEAIRLMRALWSGEPRSTANTGHSTKQPLIRFRRRRRRSGSEAARSGRSGGRASSVTRGIRRAARASSTFGA